MSSDRPPDDEPDSPPEAAPARGLRLRAGDLPLEPEQFLLLPRFRLLPNNYRKGIEVRCKGAVALRLFRAGDTICRKGDPGNSAFYLLGDADLFALYQALSTLLAKKESDKGPGRLKEPTADTLRRRIQEYQSIPLLAANRVAALEDSAKADDEIASRCEKSKDPDEQARYREWLSLNRDDRLAAAEALGADPAAELLRRSAAAQPDGALARVAGVEPPPLMRERELIGEMALYNRQPRQATVVAERDCYAVELQDNVFQELIKDEPFRAEVKQRYDRRIEESYLRALPLIRYLDDGQFTALFKRPQLGRSRRYDGHATICEQGDEADAVLLIRQGWVRVQVRDAAGQTRTVAYRGPGEFIGELALFHNEEQLLCLERGDFDGFRSATPDLEPRRTATCIAFGHAPGTNLTGKGFVELVALPYEDFWEMVWPSPPMRQELAGVARTRRSQTAGPPAVPDAPAGVRDFLQRQETADLRLHMGRQLMLIDRDRCTRCDECVRACVASHGGSRTRLYLEGPCDHIRGRDYLVPRTCRSCEDPVCLLQCPTRAIQPGHLGQIRIDADKCVGCARCAEKCPYGSIQMHDIGLVSPSSEWFVRRAEGLAEGAPPAAGTPVRLPARFDRDLRALAEEPAGLVERLRLWGGLLKAPAVEPPAGEVRQLLFWCRFRQPPAPTLEHADAALKFTAHASAEVQAWIDGKKVELAKGPVRDGYAERTATYKLPVRPDPTAPGSESVLAIRVAAAPEFNQVVLGEVRLDQKRLWRGDWEVLHDNAEKQHPYVAVVCDLCESLPEGPACVRACPHHATLRFDARQGMPPW